MASLFWDYEDPTLSSWEEHDDDDEEDEMTEEEEDCWDRTVESPTRSQIGGSTTFHDGPEQAGVYVSVSSPQAGHPPDVKGILKSPPGVTRLRGPSLFPAAEPAPIFLTTTTTTTNNPHHGRRPSFSSTSIPLESSSWDSQSANTTNTNTQKELVYHMTTVEDDDDDDPHRELCADWDLNVLPQDIEGYFSDVIDDIDIDDDDHTLDTFGDETIDTQQTNDVVASETAAPAPALDAVEDPLLITPFSNNHTATAPTTAAAKKPFFRSLDCLGLATECAQHHHRSKQQQEDLEQQQLILLASHSIDDDDDDDDDDDSKLDMDLHVLSSVSSSHFQSSSSVNGSLLTTSTSLPEQLEQQRGDDFDDSHHPPNNYDNEPSDPIIMRQQQQQQRQSRQQILQGTEPHASRRKEDSTNNTEAHQLLEQTAMSTIHSMVLANQIFPLTVVQPDHETEDRHLIGHQTSSPASSTKKYSKGAKEGDIFTLPCGKK
eukprot:scaffold78012_cov52-Attheya_sp.AAC.1